jgi:hypothetical protein
MKNIVNDPHQLVNPKLTLHDTQTYSYSNASVTYLMLNNGAGLQALMSFPQPRFTRGGLFMDKRKWWEESRCLEEGVLLSFIWLHESTVKHLFFTVAERSTDTRKENNLTHNDKMAKIHQAHYPDSSSHRSTYWIESPEDPRRSPRVPSKGLEEYCRQEHNWQGIVEPHKDRLTKQTTWIANISYLNSIVLVR